MNGMKVVAIVGMTGSGKSEVARLFSQKGFTVVRFGDVTDEAVKKLGLPLTEENERPERERIRREHGMAAYAILSAPRIDAALKNASVAVDGLYSWEEYLYLKEHYGSNFYVVGVWSSPQDRYRRLSGRKVRPLTPQQAVGRDRAEIENVNKGGPIAMADFTILNDADMGALKKQVERIAARLR
ncbi:MAG: AAA family ATPase [Dehalococcoidales bacterium]|jgi:dephospho-CoA kinase